ncbi:MAG: hypothetical protein J6Y10_05460 [Lachnospiraceae bacterium]|nr:hypothetical protein [Lachnospiraceae bacterium]
MRTNTTVSERCSEISAILYDPAGLYQVAVIGNLQATEIAVESVDLELLRIKKACEEAGCILIVTADHGNSDQMLEKNKKGLIEVRTAHSLNPVPFIIYDKDERHELKAGSFGLANVAPTVAELFGIKPYDSWEESMLL